MLEPAIAFVSASKLEQIGVDRRAAARRAAEQVDLRLADARQIVRQALPVATVPAGDRDRMRNRPASKVTTSNRPISTGWSINSS